MLANIRSKSTSFVAGTVAVCISVIGCGSDVGIVESETLTDPTITDPTITDPTIADVGSDADVILTAFAENELPDLLPFILESCAESSDIDAADEYSDFAQKIEKANQLLLEQPLIGEFLEIDRADNCEDAMLIESVDQALREGEVHSAVGSETGTYRTHDGPKQALKDGLPNSEDSVYPGIVKLKILSDDGNFHRECTGTLISNVAMLTSAHCFVGTGETNTPTIDTNGQVIPMQITAKVTAEIDRGLVRSSFVQSALQFHVRPPDAPEEPTPLPVCTDVVPSIPPTVTPNPIECRPNETLSTQQPDPELLQGVTSRLWQCIHGIRDGRYSPRGSLWLPCYDFQPIRVLIHPQYTRSVTGGDVLSQYDVALLIKDRNRQWTATTSFDHYPMLVSAVPFNTGDSQTGPAWKYGFYGYGVIEDDGTEGGDLRYSDFPADDLFRIIEFNDSPNILTTREGAGAVGGLHCVGDSGGPMVNDSGAGTESLAGIHAGTLPVPRGRVFCAKNADAGISATMWNTTSAFIADSLRRKLGERHACDTNADPLGAGMLMRCRSYADSNYPDFDPGGNPRLSPTGPLGAARGRLLTSHGSWSAVLVRGRHRGSLERSLAVYRRLLRIWEERGPEATLQARGKGLTAFARTLGRSGTLSSEEASDFRQRLQQSLRRGGRGLGRIERQLAMAAHEGGKRRLRRQARRRARFGLPSIQTVRRLFRRRTRVSRQRHNLLQQFRRVSATRQWMRKRRNRLAARRRSLGPGRR